MIIQNVKYIMSVVNPIIEENENICIFCLNCCTENYTNVFGCECNPCCHNNCIEEWKRINNVCPICKVNNNFTVHEVLVRNVIETGLPTIRSVILNRLNCIICILFMCFVLLLLISLFYIVDNDHLNKYNDNRTKASYTYNVNMGY